MTENNTNLNKKEQQEIISEDLPSYVYKFFSYKVEDLVLELKAFYKANTVNMSNRERTDLLHKSIACIGFHDLVDKITRDVLQECIVISLNLEKHTINNQKLEKEPKKPTLEFFNLQQITK